MAPLWENTVAGKEVGFERVGNGTDVVLGIVSLFIAHKDTEILLSYIPEA